MTHKLFSTTVFILFLLAFGRLVVSGDTYYFQEEMDAPDPFPWQAGPQFTSAQAGFQTLDFATHYHRGEMQYRLPTYPIGQMTDWIEYVPETLLGSTQGPHFNDLVMIWGSMDPLNDWGWYPPGLGVISATLWASLNASGWPLSAVVWPGMDHVLFE